MAIPLFVKVRPCVAQRLNLSSLRFRTADGNYLLRQSDFLVFGPLYRLNEYAAAVGGVILRDGEAAANYKGVVNTPLPEALDPEWLPAPEEDAATDTDTSTVASPESELLVESVLSPESSPASVDASLDEPHDEPQSTTPEEGESL